MKQTLSRIVTIVTPGIKNAAITPFANLLATFALFSLLSGCAHLRPSTPHTPDDIQQAHEATKFVLEAEKAMDGGGMAPTADKLPSVALTDELLYKILTSEIAYQRGNWQAAYITILSVAQQTRDPRLARRAAEMALSAKQAVESLSAIRLWRELAPESNEANQYYLGFMIMNNNLAEVQRVISEKLQKSPPQQYGSAMLQAQRMLTRARDKNAAFDVLEEILSPYKSTAEAHLALAQAAYHNSNNERAVSEAKLALKIKPDSQLAILTVAQASKKADAVKELSVFLNANPQSREVRLAYASILIDLKLLDKATLEFEHLLRDKPDDAPTIYTLGALAMESRQFAVAEKYFLSFLARLEATPAEERDPTSALINLAQIALEKKDTQAAMGWLAKVESYEGKNPLWISVQIRRSQLLAIDGKIAEARQFLQEVKANNDTEQLQLTQAEIQLLRNTKQTKEAMALLESAVQRFPDSPDLLYDYAMLAESQKKLTEMETALKRVIELAPNSQHAYNALGYSYADRNIKLNEAQTLIEKALQLAPDDPYILDSLGWVKFRLSKMDEAEQMLRRAYQLRADVEIAIHLGEVLWSAGKKDEAQKFWGEAKLKDPENETLKNTLLRLDAKR